MQWRGRGHRYQENGDIVEMQGTVSIFRRYWSATSLDGALLQITNRANEAYNKANDVQFNRVQDFRLGPVEQAAVWKANGYDDQPPYVLTGISNFNQDQYVDRVYLRPLQKNINGT